jgi:hypothetical protein
VWPEDYDQFMVEGASGSRPAPHAPNRFRMSAVWSR